MSSSLTPGTIYMKSPYGEVLDEVPADFVHPELWPEYGALFRPVGMCAREEVGSNPRGIRWSLWPITFEEYVGDSEPKLHNADHGALTRNRAVMWKRIHTAVVPAGWRSMSRETWELDAFCRIAPGEDYTQKWSPTARRDLKRWNRHQDTHTTEEVSFEEYKKAYRKGTVFFKLGWEQLRSMERGLVVPTIRENLHLFVVRNKETGVIVAGLGAVYSHPNRASMYHIPFVTREGKKLYAMTGLINHWFAHAQHAGIRMQVFTCFWHKGEKRDWKGPSEFKARFAEALLAYPPTLWQFRKGKLF